MAKKTGTVKKKVVKVGAQGMAFVHSTFNNVIITLTNEVGEVISWSSAGKMGFRGSKKNTPYAAQTAASGAGSEVTEIIDVTPMPHNGCRAPNRRRV